MMTDPVNGQQPARKVVLIGPVLPYRGGIAQHTTMLHRALQEQTDCLTISFSRQYPRWLFPGKSDRDETISGDTEPGVEYIIDSINPLTWARAVKRIKRFAPCSVIFPWWHAYWTFCFGWLSRQLKKADIEVVFLCHNVVEHETVYWNRFLADLSFRSADRFVVHTSADREIIRDRFPDVPVAVHPIPLYVQFPDAVDIYPRRAKLELLFFGFVRPYKGLDILLEAMGQLKDEDVFLSVVGEFWTSENETRKCIADEGIENKVEIVARYVPDSEAASFFTRCDVVVLPYRSATGSGVVSLSYHYGKPVIATRVGGLPEVVVEGKTGLLVKPGTSTGLATAVRSLLSKEVVFDDQAIEAMGSGMTWSGLAEFCIGKKKGSVAVGEKR